MTREKDQEIGVIINNHKDAAMIRRDIENQAGQDRTDRGEQRKAEEAQEWPEIIGKLSKIMTLSPAGDASGRRERWLVGHGLLLAG